MGRIPRDIVDAVRDRTDIVEVVSRHVKLTRRGGNFVGLCPFHQEKSPSFNVNPGKGIFHCFGCNVGGDVFKFLMMIEGLSFVEAVKELAGPAGVVIEERELTPAERRNLQRRATLYDVLEAACAFYESVLWTSAEGATARAYLERRGMTKEAAQAARLGFAPSGWSRLLDHLHRQGFDAEQVHEVGLARARNPDGARRAGYYDAFRERLIFPIRDERGRVIAFGGRLLEGDGPKYINTPETRLYEKSKVLYGLDRARAGIQRLDRVLIVEGYFDVLSMQQGGFPETVATCGTALTREHLEKLRRLTRNVVLVMDADEAGQRAAERALPLFLDVDLQPWRLEIPGAKDPDDLIREEGPEAMEQALNRREPLVEWLVRRKLAAYGRSSELGTVIDAMTQEQVVEELGPLLLKLPDPQISRIAGMLWYKEELLRARLAKLQPQANPTEALPPPQPPAWRPHRDVVHLLWLLVHRYEQVADIVQEADPRVLDAHAPVREAVARLVGGEPVAGVLEDLRDEGVRRTLSAVVARDRLYAVEEAALAVCEVLDRLDRPQRQALIAALKEEVEQALRDGDFPRAREADGTLRRIRSLEEELQKAIIRKDPRAAAVLLATRQVPSGSSDIT